MAEKKTSNELGDFSENAPWICRKTDAFINRIGRSFSWLNVVLIGTIVIQVILRYVFGKGMVMLEELQWYLYGIMIMIALSYGIVTDSHVRLSVFSQNFSQRRKDIIDAIGITVLLLPLILIILSHSVDFLADSWRVNERSDAPMGLCCRWLLKSFIPIGMILLMLSALSRLIRIISKLWTKK